MSKGKQQGQSAIQYVVIKNKEDNRTKTGKVGTTTLDKQCVFL
jgi:hypothetical protein